MRHRASSFCMGFGLVYLLLLGAGCTQRPPTNRLMTPTVPPLAMQTAPTPSPTMMTTTTPSIVCDAEHFICVSSSLVNSLVSSPITASGTAIAFENTFQWKLLGPVNQLIAEGTLMATAPDIGQPGAFFLSQPVTIPLGYATGTLRFYESSAKDGSAVHILNISIRFH